MCAGSSGNVNSMAKNDVNLGMGWESTAQSKWERLAAVVDAHAAEKRRTSRRLQSCETQHNLQV